MIWYTILWYTMIYYIILYHTRGGGSIFAFLYFFVCPEILIFAVFDLSHWVVEVYIFWGFAFYQNFETRAWTVPLNNSWAWDWSTPGAGCASKKVRCPVVCLTTVAGCPISLQIASAFCSTAVPPLFHCCFRLDYQLSAQSHIIYNGFMICWWPCLQKAFQCLPKLM